MAITFLERLEQLSELAEIKRIYASVESALSHKTPISLVVTSSLPGEGKTTLVMLLAALASRRNSSKVLAVDLNWKTPMLHKYLELVPTPGPLELDRAQPSGFHHLDVLVARPVHGDCPSGDDEYQTVTDLMQKAKQGYDLTIIDTASVFPINHCMVDPVTLAKSADGTVLMVLANKTPRQEIKRASTILSTVGANVVGLVMNHWKNPIV
ncbi:MAG: CpsD/CapB family tyrosine-protein kinase [Pseudomonadota bacterium]